MASDMTNAAPQPTASNAGERKDDAVRHVVRVADTIEDAAGMGWEAGHRAALASKPQPSDTVPVEEYRRVVARCTELGEKLASKPPAGEQKP